MATVVMVHGTSASGPAQGEHWWQEGSSFEHQLAAWVEGEDGPLRATRHIWSGENSELSRRAAADALAKRVRALEQDAEPYVIVAHSHGGSVASDMAAGSIRADQLHFLRRVVTLGTPYLTMQPLRPLFRRLGPSGQSLLITLAMLCAFNAIALWHETLDSMFPIAASAILAMGALTPLVLIYAGVWYLNRLRMWRTRPKRLATCREQLSDKWVCLYDANDEAINALAGLESGQPRIFPRTFAVGPLQVTSVLVTPLVLALVYKLPGVRQDLFDIIGGALVRLGYGARLDPTNPWALSFVTADIDKLLPKLGYLQIFINGTTVAVLLVAPLLYLLTLASHALVMRLAYALSWALSVVSDRITWTAMKSKAYGDDVLGEAVRCIAPNPPWSAQHWRPLPADLSARLNSWSDTAAADAVPRLRQILHAMSSPHHQEPHRMLAHALAWSELVHTSYYREPECLKLIAYAIATAPGFRPTPAFSADPDFSTVARWFEEIRPQPQTAETCDPGRAGV